MRSKTGGNWTPGPWKVEEPFVSIGRWDIKNNEGNEVTKIWAKGSNRAEANARLIAAAPDLYEACKTALTVTGGSKNWDGLTHGFLVEIEKAVAKAEGRRE